MIGALFIIAYAAGAWMILEEYIKETLWHAKVRKTLDEAGKKIKVVFAWRRSSSSDDELYKMRGNCVKLAQEKFTEEAYFRNFCSAIKLEN